MPGAKQFLELARRSDKGVYDAIQPGCDLMNLTRQFGWPDIALSKELPPLGDIFDKLGRQELLFIAQAICAELVPREMKEKQEPADRSCVSIIKKAARLPPGHLMLLLNQLILLEYFREEATVPEVPSDQP